MTCCPFGCTCCPLSPVDCDCLVAVQAGRMDLIRHLAETRGSFSRAEALDAGCSDRDLIHGVASGDLVRIRHGYYTFADLWVPLDDVARHLVRARAVQHLLDDRAAMSHHTGVLAHGMVTWGLDLSKIHVTRLDGASGRTEGDIIHHEGKLGADAVTNLNGLLVLPADRSVLEAGTLATSEQSLVMLDSYLHSKLGDHSTLRRRFETMNRWGRTQHLHLPVRMANGASDGPGESRGRWLFWSSGLPAPTLQYEVRRADGSLVGVADWAWEQYRLLGEFDGEVKYGRFLRPGETPGDAVFREKRREDEMREVTTWRMFRLIWADLARREKTVERLQPLFRRAA